ncbi:MAG: XkdX family protein [Oscillospiraceae bacterium]|nr:XkdX family protein [Oscillospiraceae bacterium]
MFEKIKKFYNLGLWTGVQVQQAVTKGIITQAQAHEITGG